MWNRLSKSGVALGMLARVFMAGAAGPLEQPRNAPAPVFPDLGLRAETGMMNCASPVTLAATPDGRLLLIGCAAEPCVAVFSLEEKRVLRRISVPAAPLGLALSRDGARLYAACAAARSSICVLAVPTGELLGHIPAGHTAMAPVLSPDEQTLYVCHRFEHAVSFLALPSGRELRRVPVPREPIAAAVSPDGQFLFVANHLPAGRADGDVATAAVSVIDTAAGRVVKEIALANGSGLVRDLRLSPDGQWACVTHILARFHYVPRTVEAGWINQNAASFLDARHMTLLGTVGLDDPHSGAANPWAAAWTTDGKYLCVTHAGTHELSVIDAPALLTKLAAMPARILPPAGLRHYERFAHYQRPGRRPARARTDVHRDLGWLAGLRRRVPLEGRGPRALAVVGHQAYVANYFSDSLSVVELESNHGTASIPLPAPQSSPAQRLGELHFNDASLCNQGWQSCASCHDTDGRTDALNWDLLNDGDYNPKNTKSLLQAHLTPPVMSLGVRDRAETAVRAGLVHILFTNTVPGVPAAIDDYLRSLEPLRSPHLVNGTLSPAARRGRQLFLSARTGCAQCHPPPLFTDLRAYDVGTTGNYDKPADRFDTPTLVELWRTAPYLHDGSAATLEELFAGRNPHDLHGRTSELTRQDLKDLVAFLLSL